MKHLLLTTIAVVVLVSTNAFAGPGEHFLVDEQSGYTSSYPIHDAAYDGNLAGVQAELDKGVDVDTRDYGIWDCWTPLHAAAFTGHKEIAELLIASGADVNAKRSGDWTPLHHTVPDGHKEVAELLIANGADVNAKNETGGTPLYGAAVFGQTEIAELLITNGADVNAKYEGWTPLHTAADHGHKEIAKLLIANGADVNAMDKDGRTPLHFASAKGHKEVAELLIAEGADVNVIIQSGSFQEMTPLDMATDKNRTETEDLLRKHGGKTGEELDALFDAAKTGNVTDAKKAIADDLDVNARDDEGMTPLLYAVWEGHREIVELLLANGADTSAKNPDGQTPLDLAIEYDDTEIIDLLRKHQEPETMPSLIYSKDKLTINVPFDFRFTTKAGKSYTVEATGDLLKWYKVETIRGTGSEVKFTDIRKALFERQYYRVKVVD